MNYQQTLDYLFNSLPVYQRIGAAAYKTDLHNTIQLLEAMGNPHHRLKTIHVAGTNGKGSVSHTLASILQEAGLKTGLYTSPHLKDFRERIRINGKTISKKYVVDFVEQYHALFTEIKPSFFEMTVALAFSFFANENIDIAVVEVGMGGRLDSTNVLNPLLSVITNISFDHTQFLGNTLEAIAREKAGIIKPNVSVVIGESHSQTKDVFIEIAKNNVAPIYFADKMFDIQVNKKKIIDGGFYSYFDVNKDNKLIYKNLKSPLAGLCQEKNLKTIFTAVSLLQKELSITKSNIANGIKKCIENTHLMGRWQLLGTKPMIIADTGHNQAGITLICEQIKQMKYNKLHFVLGVVNDKDLQHIFTLLPQDAVYYFCKANIPRGLDANILQQEAKKYALSGKVYTSVKNALRAAKRNTNIDDLIFVGGSTFTVAEVV